MTTTARTGLPDLGANHEGASEDNFLSAGPVSEDIANYWTDRREHFMRWLPCASRPELEARALREFDRAESAAFCIGEEHRRADCAAQRQASWAVCEAEDWVAASKRPSYAELTSRRAVVD